MGLGSSIRGPGSGKALSGIRKNPIPDPGFRGQKGIGSGSGSATLLFLMKWQLNCRKLIALTHM
jgi:hypothetical protein